eukprot:1155061-Pelagomonas_calceolata.AAC.2
MGTYTHMHTHIHTHTPATLLHRGLDQGGPQSESGAHLKASVWNVGKEVGLQSRLGAHPDDKR